MNRPPTGASPDWKKVLSERGLGPALRALARRSAVPVELDVTTSARFPEPVEIAAYYVASEALANVVKHARACACRPAGRPAQRHRRVRRAGDGPFGR
jgi:signal transduction histidine kinase